MDLNKNDIYDILTGFGFTLLGITTVFSGFQLYKYLNEKLENIFFDYLNIEDDSITTTVENFSNTINQLETISLEINNPLSVLYFINKHFIKDLILMSRDNINNNYYILTSNNMFFQLLKSIFEDRGNRLECVKNLENPFDRLGLHLFFNDLEKSKSLDDFRKIKRNDRIMSIVLQFIINKFNIV